MLDLLQLHNEKNVDSFNFPSLRISAAYKLQKKTLSLSVSFLFNRPIIFCEMKSIALITL